MKLYDYLPSGNGYKVRLLCAWLGLDYDYVPLDIHAGETRTDGFLAINPAGQIPVLVLDDGRALPESNAILGYLAEGTRLLPDDPWDRAQAFRWLFWEQYRHEPSIAVARFIRAYAPEARAGELPALAAKGEAALRVMEEHLAARDWFVGEDPTIADVALYAYTHVAGEGGFDLGRYPAVTAWLARVAAQPGTVAITDHPGGA